MARNKTKNPKKTGKIIKKEIKKEVNRSLHKKMPKAGNSKFAVQSKQLMSLLDQNKSALLAMSITGRLPVPVPDGNNKRVNVNPLYAAFPLAGNSVLGTPSLIDSSGNFSLCIRASLKNTISTQATSAVGVSYQFSNTLKSAPGRGMSNSVLQSYTANSITGYDFSDLSTGKSIGTINASSRIFFPMRLASSSSSTSQDYYPIASISSTTTTLGVPYGYLMQTGQTYTCSIPYDSTFDGTVIGWFNTTTGVVIGTPTTIAGNLGAFPSSFCTVGTTTGATNNQYCVPYLLTTSSNSVSPVSYIVTLTSSTTTNVAARSIDMPQAADPLLVSTYKKSRVTGFAVWFQNTSNITKVGGDCAAFWLNPDQAVNYQLPSPTAVIAAASTRTRDRYVGPFVNGIYTFERIHRENLVFQPSLDIDDGYRLIMAGSPGGAAADVQGYIHVWMILESEVESSILSGNIAPHMVNVMAEFETAVSRIPNNVMENSAHAAILRAIMAAGSKAGSAIRNITSLPFVKSAAGAGASAVLHSLANSAAPSYSYGPPLTMAQSAQRRQRQVRRRR